MSRLVVFGHLAFSLLVLDLFALNGAGIQAGTSRFGGIWVMAAWLFLCRKEFDFSRLLSWRAWLFLGAGIAAVRSETTALWYPGGMLLLSALGTLCADRGTFPFRSVLLGGLFYYTGWLFYLLTPSLFHPFRSIFWAWSGCIGGILDRPLVLGPTISGFWAGALLACVLGARYWFLERDGRRLVAGLAGLGVLHLAYAGFLARARLSFEEMTFAPNAFGVLGLLWTAWLCSSSPREDAARASAGNLPRKPFRLAGGLAAVFFLCARFLPWDALPDRPAVLFYSANEGPILNWDKPEHGRYGAYSQGMFGQLPDLLRADRFNVRFLKERIGPDSLSGADLLVLINADTPWTEQELKTIWGYVRSGGNLLLLGDHTDVMGTRQSQNSVLAPVGIELNFDGAVPSRRQGWTGADLFFHPVFAGVRDPAKLGIGVGATLSLAGGAGIPLVASRFGLADLGDATAADRAFLGDYAYQRGEPVGDILLAAWAPYGEGKFVVFGDTSSFQNAALSGTYDPFLRNIFLWSSARKGFSLGKIQILLSLLFVAFAAAALWRARASIPSLQLLGGILFLSASGADCVEAWRMKREGGDLPTALVDTSHGPRVDHASEGKNAIMGLFLNLERNGYRVRPLENLSEEALAKGRIFVTIAPVERFDAEEVRWLEAFAERGGLIVAAAGYFQKRPLESLMAAFDLDIGDAPVGPIPLAKQEGRMRLGVEYVEAWPVLVGPSWKGRPDIRVYGAFRDVPLAVWVRRGKGGFFLVGDTCFFSAKNLEGLTDVSLPNVGFLKQLMDDFKSGWAVR